MKQESIAINWAMLGAKLATLSDHEQAEFFRGFAIELSHFESHYAREMQLMYVNAKLTKDTKAVLKEYFPALWYEEDS